MAFETKEQVLETNGRLMVEFVRSIAGDRYLCLEEGSQSEWLYEVLEPRCELGPSEAKASQTRHARNH